MKALSRTGGSPLEGAFVRGSMCLMEGSKAYGFVAQADNLLGRARVRHVVTVLNQTVVAPALPSVMAEMSVDASTAQWLTTGFTLVKRHHDPDHGVLDGPLHHEALFLVSMVIFTAGSALAGWGPNFAVLLLGRLVQAAGAGILMAARDDRAHVDVPR